MCDGKDRFRFDDKDGRGTWFCNQCGHGDGFDLIQGVTGKQFKEVAKEIDALRPKAPEPSDEPFKPKVDVESRRRVMNSTWQAAQDGQLVLDYLTNRGISDLDSLCDLRGHPALYFRDQELGQADFPAVVGLIRNPLGVPVSIHRTYLLPNGARLKKIMPPTEPITGGAIRLVQYRKGGALIVGEGIETALAGREIYRRLRNAPQKPGVWATISANGLRDIQLPADIGTLVICADADKTFTGQAAAFELARRAHVQNKHHQIKMVVVGLPVLNQDMVDSLSQGTPVNWMGSNIDRKA